MKQQSCAHVQTLIFDSISSVTAQANLSRQKLGGRVMPLQLAGFTLAFHQCTRLSAHAICMAIQAQIWVT